MAIRGATGSNAANINGLYEPTEELHDEHAVYMKSMSDGAMWIEYRMGLKATGRWVVKKTRASKTGRGKSKTRIMKGNTTACAAAVTVEQVPAWKVKDGGTWGAQASVSVQRAPIATAVRGATGTIYATGLPDY